MDQLLTAALLELPLNRLDSTVAVARIRPTMASDLPSKNEIREAMEAAMALAIAITRSRQRAEDVVQEAFERVWTTRSWDRSKGPFERHVVGAVRSKLNIAFHSVAPQNQAKAHERFHDEVVGRHSESAEVIALEHESTTEREALAQDELEQLRASVADHPVALQVLDCRVRGVQKAAAIAREIGRPVDQVYRANELLKEHAKKVREARECESQAPKKS